MTTKLLHDFAILGVPNRGMPSQPSDAGANEQSRRVVGTEVSQIYNQLVLVGNRKLGDRYIFGGLSYQPFLRWHQLKH